MDYPASRIAAPSTLPDFLAQPEIILPEQMRGGVVRFLPEQRLLAATLSDALEQYPKMRRQRAVLAGVARWHHRTFLAEYEALQAWLFEEAADDNDPRFTFAQCCEYLGLDVSAVRAKLMR